MQIRARLTLLFVLMAAGILAGVLCTVYFLFKKNTEEAFFQGLESKAEMTAQTALRDPGTFTPMPNNWSAPDGDSLPYRDNISIFNGAYERVFSMHADAPPVTVKDLQDVYQQGAIRFQHYNLLALGRMAEGPAGRSYAVVVEGYCDPTTLRQLRNILIISFFAGLFLVAVSGWYYAGQALEPMSRIVGEVEKIQPTDLSRRVEPGPDQDEISRLAETFNRLLDRVQQAFTMQRMFLSNVSHELRNPLTVMRAQLEVSLQRERAPEAYRQTIQSVLNDVRAFGEVEEKLLQLARIYNDPGAIPFGPIRLDELLWQTKQILQKRHPEYRIMLGLGDLPDDEQTLLVRANEPLLQSALLNLMSNACKYSPDHGVLLRAQFSADGRHALEVCDKGPGIPIEEQSLIFEPFFRSPRHLAVKGTGIGLSLVKSIVSLHGIDLSVESPAEGGTVFRLVFPESVYLSDQNHPNTF